jgi:hypothetical protein
LEILLTDINACNRAGQRGRSRLVSRVNRSNGSRYGRSVGRRFPDGGRYDAFDRLRLGLHDRGVHGRASGRGPRIRVAILDRLVVGVTPELRRRNHRSRGGENRQNVERELHICYEVFKNTKTLGVSDDSDCGLDSVGTRCY